MALNGLTKAYDAGAAITAHSIVKFGSSDYAVVLGAAATDLLIGVTTEIAAASGERVDVIHGGIADVKLGGTVARGEPVTSDDEGLGVKAAPTAAAANRIVGYALISGDSGDIIPVLLAPSEMRAAAA